MAFRTSSPLPANRQSLGSFRGNEAMKALPGVSTSAASWAAACPGSSMSNMMMTFS